MKRLNIIVIFMLFFIHIQNVSAKELVTLSKCVDGDTAWFYLNNEEIKTRFLAIDTPESTKEKEPFGIEASNFTCNALKTAKRIEIEYDKNSEKLDKYNRHLVWVFVDDKLLQEMLIENGLAEVKYLYNDYKYTNILEKKEEIAKKSQINIWKIKDKTFNENKNSHAFLLSTNNIDNCLNDIIKIEFLGNKLTKTWLCL